jgi:hypothetical protein
MRSSGMPDGMHRKFPAEKLAKMREMTVSEIDGPHADTADGHAG